MDSTRCPLIAFLYLLLPELIEWWSLSLTSGPSPVGTNTNGWRIFVSEELPSRASRREKEWIKLSIIDDF